MPSGGVLSEVYSTRKQQGLKRRISELPLRARVFLSLSLLIILSIAFTGFLLYQQYSAAKRGAEVAIGAHEVISRTSQLREALAEIDRYAALGEVNQTQVEKFNELVSSIADSPGPGGKVEHFSNLQERFDAYISELAQIRTPTDKVVRARYEDVSNAVASMVSANDEYVERVTERLLEEQKSAMEFALAMLGLFLFALWLGGIKIASIVVNPLTSLARFFDQIHVEDDLPSAMPAFSSNVPEVSTVTKSFEQVLQRLRGYRSLNVRRLLIEKRQADVIAASISDGIVLLRDEEILHLNPVAERILGLLPGQFSRGMQLAALINPDAEKKQHGVRAVMTAVAQTMPVEFTLALEDRKLSYLISAQPISYDVIEQVEHMVPSPVEQILDRFQANTLIVARDISIVRESQEAKSHFLGTLSHEVKTPVTSLTMATRLLKKSIEQFPNPMHRNLITTCAEDVDRLRKLLEDLLTVTRFDTLTQRLEFQSVDFIKMVRHAVQGFQIQANERGVELIYRSLNTQGPIVVAMDPAKVTWAVSNLLTNALRHTPRGGKVETFIEPFDDRVEVRIRDTGPGIEKARQERIFDKFNPFYDIRVARSGGAGVGLAIAREIVVAHGGKIWVSSEPGSGAEFCFMLPVKAEQKLGGELRTELASNLQKPAAEPASKQ